MADQSELQSLVGKAQAGDRAAFSALINRFEGRLLLGIQRQFNAYRSSEAVEVVQEAFVQALAAIHRFRWRGEDSFYPWLYGIARNVALKFAEKSARNRSLEIPEHIAADAATPSTTARREERFDRLERSLSQLKPDYRKVLYLARIEGLTVHQIAVRMNRTEYAVKHLIARALRQLRESFGDTESLHLPPRSFKREAEDHGPR